VRLAVPFDKGPHACVAAANPFSAGAGQVGLVPDGRHGKALRLASAESANVDRLNRAGIRKSTLIFDGANLPDQRGTVAFHVRAAPDRDVWSDGGEYWLAVLTPRVGIHGATMGLEGTGLAVVKESDNTVALRLYHFHDDRLGVSFGTGKYAVAPPDETPLRLETSRLQPGRWVLIRVAWDQALGRVWLGVGDRIESAACRFRPTSFLCLLVGCSPKPYHAPQLGFCGDLDDLLVDERTPEQFADVGRDWPQRLPPMAAPKTRIEPAKSLGADPWAARIESLARTHLARVIENQHVGGWAFSIAFPSGMRFLSGSTVTPIDERFFNGAKARNSSFVAMWLAAAHEILGDVEFLTAAENTARTLLATQHEAGFWPYGALFRTGEVEPDFLRWGRPDHAPIQDHVQAYPILLLLQLHAVTGKAPYRTAAHRGAELLLAAQNPNGSWPHEYDTANARGDTVGHVNGGEVNDYTTTGSMNVMLLMYRRTGDPKWLASFLRGAEWLLAAFIDRGAVGWAQQYDAENRPVQARHSEPPAVSLSEGARGIAPALLTAYRLTAERKYLAPLRKWLAWLERNRKYGGWRLYYDVETGRPVRSFQHKVSFIDESQPPPGGKLPDPGIATFLRTTFEELDSPTTRPAPYAPGPTATRAQLASNRPLIDGTLAAFDPEVGSWPYVQAAQGRCWHPGRWQVERLLWAALAARLLEGQLPWRHRLADRTYPADWDYFSLLISRRDLERKLSAAEAARANALMGRQKPGDDGERTNVSETTGKEWLRDVLIIVSPGTDVAGERVPGGWQGRVASQIEQTAERAFTGERSLKVRLRKGHGGCSRILPLPPGRSRLRFSCHLFVPEGQPFKEFPAACMWRGRGVVAARADPVRQTGKWAESVLDIERPAGKLFYFGVSAACEPGARPFFYVDAFRLRCEDRDYDLLAAKNPDFEVVAEDKRAQLIADFRPDLLNAWLASRLNRDGLLHKHGVRVASWGRVEYDAASDFDKRLDEFRKACAKRDFDGAIVTAAAHPPFTFRMCHHAPVWHEYQKGGLTRILGDNDALGQDNLMQTSFRSGLNNCFCEYCQRDFREHLKKRFGKDELSKLLPGPVDDFSIAGHIKAVRPQKPGFTLLDDPLAREYVRSQYLHEKGFAADIAGAIRRRAAAQGRTVPFFGNQGSAWGGQRWAPRMVAYSVIIADTVDAQCLECGLHQPYREFHRHAWWPLQCRLMGAATRRRKPVWPLLGVDRFEQHPSAADLYVADALSSGAVPMLVWTPSGLPPQDVYEKHATHARFMDENRALFLRRRPVARVAIVYSAPTCIWRSFPPYWKYWLMGGDHARWIGGAARVFEDAHIPYDVVVFGHPEFLDDTDQLAALPDYDAVILAGVDCVSDPQAAAVRQFAERGGRIVTVGELGTRTEDYTPRREPLGDELAAAPLPVGRVVALSATCMADFMDLAADPAKVRQAFEALRDAAQPGPPLLETDAPATLWTSLWQDPEQRRLALHMVNHNVDLERHSFVAAQDFQVTLRVPPDFRFDRVRLLAPGRPEQELPFERNGHTVSFRVPSVECYAIAVLTTGRELDAANLIEAAKRALDRVRLAARGASLPAPAPAAALAEAERAYHSAEYPAALTKAAEALKPLRRRIGR